VKRVKLLWRQFVGKTFSLFFKRLLPNGINHLKSNSRSIERREKFISNDCGAHSIILITVIISKEMEKVL
jgi:hypothetical protein